MQKPCSIVKRYFTTCTQYHADHSLATSSRKISDPLCSLITAILQTERCGFGGRNCLVVHTAYSAAARAATLPIHAGRKVYCSGTNASECSRRILELTHISRQANSLHTSFTGSWHFSKEQDPFHDFSLNSPLSRIKSVRMTHVRWPYRISHPVFSSHRSNRATLFECSNIKLFPGSLDANMAVGVFSSREFDSSCIVVD